MPAKCPKCGRLSQDQRTRCLYCGEQLGSPSPLQSAGIDLVSSAAPQQHEGDQAQHSPELDTASIDALAAKAANLLQTGQGMVSAANRGESFEDGTPLLLEAARAFERLAGLRPPGSAYLQSASRAYALAGQYQHAQRLEAMSRKAAPAAGELSLELDDGSAPMASHQVHEILEAAGRMMKAGNVREAIAEFDRATQLDPYCVDAWIELGIGLATLGDLEAAVDSFGTATRVDPSNARAHDWRGMCLARSGRNDAALESFARALAADPHNATVLRHRGSTLVQMQQWDAAAESFELASQAAPEMVECKYMLADVRVRQGRHAEAPPLLREFLARVRDPNSRAASSARQLLERVEVSQAQAAHPQDPVARARALIVLGWHAHAIASCDEAIEATPRSADAWCLRGVARMHAGALQEALVDLQKATELAPRSLEAWNALAVALLQSGNARRAFAVLSHAAEIDPSHAPTWSNRAHALCGLERYDEALESAEHALRLDRGLAEAVGHRGCALAGLGRDPEAFACFKDAGRMDPRSPAHAANAARVLARMGRLDQALPIAEHALKLSPRDPLALEVHAELQAQRKR